MTPARVRRTAGARRAALALLFAACVDLGTVDTQVHIWKAVLTPITPRPGFRGNVGAVTQAGGTDVGIGLSGAVPGAEHVWGVWYGSCAAPGTLIGTPQAYPVLVVADSGGASADMHLGLKLPVDSTYHAEVRESAADSARVACGDLIRQ